MTDWQLFYCGRLDE